MRSAWAKHTTISPVCSATIVILMGSKQKTSVSIELFMDCLVASSMRLVRKTHEKLSKGGKCRTGKYQGNRVPDGVVGLWVYCEVSSKTKAAVSIIAPITSVTTTARTRSL